MVCRQQTCVASQAQDCAAAWASARAVGRRRQREPALHFLRERRRRRKASDDGSEFCRSLRTLDLSKLGKRRKRDFGDESQDIEILSPCGPGSSFSSLVYLRYVSSPLWTIDRVSWKATRCATRLRFRILLASTPSQALCVKIQARRRTGRSASTRHRLDGRAAICTFVGFSRVGETECTRLCDDRECSILTRTV